MLALALPPLAVTSVSSSRPDASLKAGDVISVQVNFNGDVTVAGAPQLTLETGTVDRVLNLSSASGSTLTFIYTVQEGDTSADLDYVGTDALSLNGGSIQDGSGNDADLTLPAPGTAGSLGANKDLVIDTSAPDTTIISGPAALTNSTDATFEFGTGDGIAFEVSLDGSKFVTTGSSLPLTGVPDGEHTLVVRAKDRAGNVDTTPATYTWTVDSTAPTVAIELSDTSLTAGETSLVTFTFSEAVTGFNNADLTVEGGTLSSVASNDGGVTWTGTFTPAVDFTDATNAITLALSGVSDGFGNAGRRTTASPNYTIDTRVNDAPTAVTLGIQVTTAIEGGAAVKVADVTVADDDLGTETLSLVGSDAGSFEIRGTELWFRGGADFETKNSYAVQVKASDEDGLSATSQAFTLAIGDLPDIGGRGKDQLSGGSGDNILKGGLGADVLLGGEGADRFVFSNAKDSPSNGFDRILDFSQAEGDQIDLSGLGSLKWRGEKSFKGSGDELRFEQKKGDTFVQVDLDGDRQAEFTIKLEGLVDLGKGDFIL
ncbi:MAG TPA: Ig-like domain-containing protein [Microvirga sp.]|jgi:Ca2+-binding RTX toxin-like protein|nr:Ig-like domain-containing protein [Microvirga sp.]